MPRSSRFNLLLSQIELTARERGVFEKHRKSVKSLRVAKLIKYWRTRRTPHLALSSFHLELLLAESRVCVGIKRYEECLYEAFALLARRGCRAVRDPLSISGLVAAVKTEPQRVRAQRAASLAADQIRRALLAEDKGKVREADRLWHLVFKIPYRRR